MQASVSFQAPTTIDKIRPWVIIFLIVIAVSVAAEYGLNSFIAFSFLCGFVFTADILIIKKLNISLNRVHARNRIILFISIPLMVICGILYLTELFSEQELFIVEFFFLAAQVILGVIIANVILQILYYCDSDMELMNKLEMMKHHDRINFIHFWEMFFMESFIWVFFSIITYFLISGLIDNEFHITFDSIISLFSRITFFIILYIFAKKKYPEIIETFRMPRAGKKYIIIALFSGIALYYIVRLVTHINDFYIGYVLDIPFFLKNMEGYCYSAYSDTFTYKVIDLVSVVIAAPIVEEFFFRGFIYKLMKNRYGITKAFIISTALFSLVHFDVFYRFIPLITTSLIFPYLYEKSKSLIPPIIVHSVFNLMATMM